MADNGSSASTGDANVDAPSPPPSPGATATKVFLISELMEHILTNLSARQLFGVRRVNRIFNATINDFPSLQHAMFLQTPTPIVGDFIHDANPRLRPLLEDLVLFGEQDSGFSYKAHSSGYGRSHRGGDGLSLIRTLEIWYDLCYADDLDLTTRRLVGGNEGAVEESWRRTLVTQADPAVLEAWTGFPLSPRSWRRQGTFDAGVTLGDLVDRLLAATPVEERAASMSEDDGTDGLGRWGRLVWRLRGWFCFRR
ncbi:hypothetical protein M409DRAFT_60543 [Zasmidium cellare ATCC 36951]|uniref:F-box domain-containing protein n=1 Tax=Zasmidium cellare ATCC 36951 TaxID=1080233 RepID=A0A6A6BYA6_ZASCE|nr:uncharacterized protein M409DRAFT_60543 [Zasmidium cellare ATCC 36951]KAF2159771.1 hypothetical protein M409DRAFT_60543 [Zasmidium cellare ATCC 36951]